MKNTSGGLALSGILQALADDAQGERISIGDLLTALDDRALGALLFIFAFPNVLPMPPGTSAVLGAPLLFLSAQLAFNLNPWLPSIIAKRSMSRADFQKMVDKISPWLKRAERMLRPRASVLALPPMEYVLGFLCLLLSLLVVLPIPFGNMMPALAVSMLALGVLERDGYWVIAGLAATVASAVIVSSVIFAIVQAAIYMLTQWFT